jgi:hypothetical protein
MWPFKKTMCTVCNAQIKGDPVFLNQEVTNLKFCSDTCRDIYSGKLMHA